MITANSFMKREFGKKLIEEHIPRWDLTHVIDTSGAYIPGHGTPTVILLGRHRRPVGDAVRAVMGIRGEPQTPEDPARGLVWTAILDQMDRPGSESEYVSVAEIAKRLAPPAVQTICDAWREMRASAAADERRFELELERRRARVGDLRRRYMLVDPENRMVAAELEAELEAAVRELKRTESSGAPPIPLDLMSDDAFDDLVSLCGDFDALWNAPTTENRDRKEIVRTGLADVVIEERTEEQILARLRWADGSADTLVAVKLGAWSQRRVAELFREGLRAGEIAERLNQEGLRTLKGRAWTRPTVESALRSLRKRQGRAKKAA